jgi:hypothetical protein
MASTQVAPKRRKGGSSQVSNILSYTDDVDLNSQLKVWESFYNYNRPHISHDGKTPFEVMRSLLK